MMIGLNPNRILQGLAQLSKQKTGTERNFREVYDYCMLDLSEKVVRIILSCTYYTKGMVGVTAKLNSTFSCYFPLSFAAMNLNQVIFFELA